MTSVTIARNNKYLLDKLEKSTSSIFRCLLYSGGCVAMWERLQKSADTLLNTTVCGFQGHHCVDRGSAYAYSAQP